VSKAFDLRHPITAFMHDGTVVAAMELSGKSWIISGAVPGVARHPKKALPVGDIAGVKAVLDGWVGESARSSGLTARKRHQAGVRVSSPACDLTSGTNTKP
jgi:hypothetical protein